MLNKNTVTKLVTLGAVFLLCISLYLRLYKFSSIQFDSDFGRDSLFAMRILQGKLTLLGPQASVGGFYLGPLYFYFLALMYLITGPVPSIASLTFIFMGTFTLVIGYKLQKKYVSKLASILFLMITVANAILIYASRSATNQPMMPFVTLLLVWSLMRALEKKTLRSFFVSGLAFGLFFHVHYSALLLLPGYLLATVLLLKGAASQRIQRIFAVSQGMLVMLLPLILFDFRHKFLLFHAFLDYTFKTMKGEAILTNLQHVTSQEKITFLLTSISRQTYLSVGILVGTAIAFYVWRKKIVGISKTYIHMLALIFFPALLLLLLYRGYVFSYYFLTVNTVGLLLFSAGLSYIRPRLIPILLCAVIFIVGASSYGAEPNYRTILNLSRVTRIIEENVDTTHPASYTIFKDSSDQLTGLAYEYRFLLERNTYTLVNENYYSAADVLYVIREEGMEDPLTLGHWEVSQFNPKHKEEIGHIDFTNPTKNVTIFRLTR